jgi:PAS domain S-box-containing protein
MGEESSRYLEAIFIQGRRVVVASFLAHAVDLFVLPIIFQIFQNRRCRLFFSVLGTLVMAQVIDSFVFQLIAYPQLNEWWRQLRMTYLARASVMIWLSTLTTIYLHMCNIKESRSRRPLDIIFDFLGGYGKAQELQKYLLEWEGRYHVVVQNSSDFIFIVDDGGGVLNANDAALTGLGYDPDTVGFHLPSILRDIDGNPCDWDAIWYELYHAEGDGTGKLYHVEWQVLTASGETILLDANISKAHLMEKPAAVVIARDVTARRRLEEERRGLEEQLMHAQRMEAIGQLAGGISHDFNNLLHTVQGSLDGLAKQWELSAVSRALVGNIEEATSRASELMKQLLGFARKGKYHTERLDVAEIMERVRSLFEPVAHKNITFKMIVSPDPMIISGDGTQLQQVFLNMLLNARDAVHETQAPGKIVFRAELARDYTPGWQFCERPDAEPAEYICVRIKDNGAGIPSDVRQSIFDPFFTTKGVGKGTGMGLAMAYGCIVNHHGWIHVESEVGKGTEFFIFLPRI